MTTPSRPTKKQRDDERRAATAVAKRALIKTARRRQMVWAGAVVVAVALVTTLIVVGVGGSSRSSTPAAALPSPVTAAGGSAPPWPAPVSPDDNIAGAGLRLLNQEGTALHFHAHLDILVNGAPIAVPADLGINVKSQMISEMHTHDTTGVIHIEAPDAARRYVLGQLFVEWGVRLDTGHVGDLATSTTKTLVGYVNGKRVTGNLSQIELTPHEQITLAYGNAGANPPVASSYPFPAGE